MGPNWRAVEQLESRLSGTLKNICLRFELDRLQRHHFEAIRTFNEYLREEYHSIQDLLWKTGNTALYGEIPERYGVLAKLMILYLIGHLYLSRVLWDGMAGGWSRAHWTLMLVSCVALWLRIFLSFSTLDDSFRMSLTTLVVCTDHWLWTRCLEIFTSQPESQSLYFVVMHTLLPSWMRFVYIEIQNPLRLNCKVAKYIPTFSQRLSLFSVFVWNFNEA